MTPILLLIRRQIYRGSGGAPTNRAAEHARTGAGLLQNYTLQQITLCHNTPQTFEHRAFPRFGRDIGPGLDLAFSEPHVLGVGLRAGGRPQTHTRSWVGCLLWRLVF